MDKKQVAVEILGEIGKVIYEEKPKIKAAQKKELDEQAQWEAEMQKKWLSIHNDILFTKVGSLGF